MTFERAVAGAFQSRDRKGVPMAALRPPKLMKVATALLWGGLSRRRGGFPAGSLT